MKSEKQLFQWDVNQYLTELQPEAQFVDYPMSNEVIRIETDGKRCRIPDEFLQTAGFKTCYERYSDGTYKAYNFNVQSSPKPPDYVYTADERTTFEALVNKADAAITEIKRRADSGEFTPKKGVDYFTEEEKNELMESVSDGAIGEFRKVVDSATTELSDNHNLQLAKYNANASEKLTTYDTNAEQHTTDYNRNAEQKLEAYNQNHTEKVAEYNQNAAALQNEVDRLRGECDTLAAENRKQETQIDALIKLNKGQTYDILPEEGESASRTAPNGAKYVSVDKVGGKSFVEAGEIVSSTTANVELEGKNLWDDSDPAFTQVLTKAGFTFDGSVWKSELIDYIATPIKIEKGKKFSYDIKAPKGANVRFKFAMDSGNLIYRPHESDGSWKHHSVYLADDVHTIYVDYTQRASCEIKNIQLERGTTETAYSPHTKQTITTGFPELRSALAAHDYIDMDGGKVHRKIKSVRIDGETPIYSVHTDQDNCCRVVFTPESSPGIVISEKPTIPTNIISDKLATITHNNYWSADAYTGIEAYPGYASISMRLQDRTDLDTKDKVSVWLADNPMTVYYAIESEEVADVTIPEALQEWLPVEAGGTVTFRNADESKQLAVPNSVSWVRKLDEVE